MLEWLKSSFEGFFVVYAWIILLSFAICGAIVGYNVWGIIGSAIGIVLGYNVWVIIGGAIGVVLGLVLAIDILGLIAIYIFMAKKVGDMAQSQNAISEKLSQLISSLQNDSSKI